MDQIIIKNLEVFGRHGVFPEENRLGQKFLVSAVLSVNARDAGLLDDLNRSVDYGAVCSFMDRFLRENTYKLLESAAENLAEALLTNFDGLFGIALEIKKPWAPIGLPLQEVSVRIERSWHTAYIALGSNLGDKVAYLSGAVEALRQDRRCRVGEVSDFMVTKPYGYAGQEDFLNGALRLETLLSPRELLAVLHGIEAGAGRERTLRWGPRTLDLDILFYDSMILDAEDLTVPHPDLQNRDFVLRPLMQIAHCYRHPLLGKTVRELWEELEALEARKSDEAVELADAPGYDIVWQKRDR